MLLRKMVENRSKQLARLLSKSSDELTNDERKQLSHILSSEHQPQKQNEMQR